MSSTPRDNSGNGVDNSGNGLGNTGNNGFDNSGQIGDASAPGGNGHRLPGFNSGPRGEFCNFIPDCCWYVVYSRCVELLANSKHLGILHVCLQKVIVD